MDVKSYMQKNPHLTQIEELSEPSVSINMTKLSDVQNLVHQVSASKSK